MSSRLMNIMKLGNRFIPSIYKFNQAHYSKLYEPDYLDVGKSEIPVYSDLLIKISGFDYPVLEKYQKFIHKMIEAIDLEVETGYALPSKKLIIQNFKKLSSVTENEYKLSIYQRNIQVLEPPSTLVPILLRIIEACIPEGVKIEVQPFSPLIEEERYIPDKDLLELKTKLELSGGPSKKKS